MRNIAPKIIFVDWHKTLSVSRFWQHMELESHPLHYLNNRIRDYLFVKNEEMVMDWMRGEYTSEDICDIVSQEIDASFLTLFKELKYSCENMSLLFPNVLEIVSQIRKQGIKVVIATDNMDTFPRFTVPALDLKSTFDDVLCSWNLTYYKADYWKGKLPFFDSYLKKNGLSYTDALLIDDSEDKEGNYEVLGFKRILVDETMDVQSALKLFL